MNRNETGFIGGQSVVEFITDFTGFRPADVRQRRFFAAFHLILDP